MGEIERQAGRRTVVAAVGYLTQAPAEDWYFLRQPSEIGVPERPEAAHGQGSHSRYAWLSCDEGTLSEQVTRAEEANLSLGPVVGSHRLEPPALHDEKPLSRVPLVDDLCSCRHLLLLEPRLDPGGVFRGQVLEGGVHTKEPIQMMCPCLGEDGFPDTWLAG